ncbi:MAG: acylphosphatase [candidate division NC10 bacterium]|nr:acylphosphatase [candidate division NC10 bacterium]
MASMEVLVSGIVQGVGYRFFAERVARALSVTGYAMNLWTGEVKVVAEGRKEDLLAFLERLRQGPRGAYIEDCRVSWGTYEGKYADFGIRFAR